MHEKKRFSVGFNRNRKINETNDQNKWISTIQLKLISLQMQR